MRIVTSDWLSARLREARILPLDCRPRSSYRRGHILGAINLDLLHDYVEDTGSSGIEDLRRSLINRASRLGLTGREKIVAYDRGLGIRATKVAWALEYLGFKSVFLLEGGFDEWRSKHLQTTTRKTVRKLTRFVAHLNNNVLATRDLIMARKGDQNFVVLDVRSQDEYTGHVKRACDERPGRIPGSVWLEWTALMTDMHHFKKPIQVKDILEKLQLSKDSEIVTYCHSGARASNTYAALRLLGFRNVKTYIGSWHEWSSRKDLPVELD